MLASDMSLGGIYLQALLAWLKLFFLRFWIRVLVVIVDGNAAAAMYCGAC